MRANSSALAGTGSLGHWGLFFLPACTLHASGHCVHVLTGGHPRIYHQLAEAACAPSGRFCIWDESRAIIHEPAVKAHAHKAFPVIHAQRAAHMRARSLPPVNNNVSSNGRLTQNMRLKANIRCLTHVSPPDSAAMAAFNLWITLAVVFRTWSSRTQQTSSRSVRAE